MKMQPGPSSEIHATTASQSPAGRLEKYEITFADRAPYLKRLGTQPDECIFCALAPESSDTGNFQYLFRVI